jgi:steroid 5-alpha reductase family enzyme
MGVHVLDSYYLSITLLITIAYQLLFFSIAFSLKFDKLTDFAGGTNFVLLAILTLAFSATHSARQIVASLFILIWGARLSAFLLFRIIKTGKDDRFDDKRDDFFKFLGFWVFQMVWVWTVSLPVTILNSPAVTAYQPQPAFGTGRDIAGVVLWSIGFAMESYSDVQKYRFRSDDANKGKTCDVGLFSWSRHPNYFGEIIMQFAIFMIAVTPAAEGAIPSGSGAYAALYASILGAVFLTVLLMFVSGLTLQERPGGKKKFEGDGPDGPGWLQWKRWTERTSILIPFPPWIYARLPVVVKRTLFLEFPIYVFDPSKHADLKKVEERRAEEGERQGSRDALRTGQEGESSA